VPEAAAAQAAAALSSSNSLSVQTLAELPTEMINYMILLDFYCARD